MTNNKLHSTSITQVLNKAYQGDQRAMNDLMPMVFHELKKIASRQRHSYRIVEKTLNTTALVNEAWIKINRSESQHFNDKKHFYSIAALAMKQILLDQAKKKSSAKRQSNLKDTNFDVEQFGSIQNEAEWLLQLEHLLSRLEKISPRLTELFQLKFFCDLTFDELAECFDVSKKTAQRDWQKIKSVIVNAMSLDT
ncbi:ECF-type sigma factor [Marinicella sp. S1101]|uniref:ECF-type sigma factor n=1 Tax=Marinicella marina TaxID=2996016 RepID=UPI0022608A28|nr:ECF-type sigma factor [Marinicella marina]MCX7554246.1 ECF-type sigma factor [Marinicella marina]MDJ1138761.1 ECF-type sigma factor [Marinicella marina]